MNLYLSLGRIWTGTQADAKEAQGGKDFRHIEFPTDKPGLLDTLNRMRELFPGMFEVKDGVLGEQMAAPEPVDDEWVENVPDREDYPPAVRNAVIQPAANPADCPTCNRSARIAKVVANAQAGMTIKADLEDITSLTTLAQISDAVEARIKVLMEAQDGAS